MSQSASAARAARRQAANARIQRHQAQTFALLSADGCEEREQDALIAGAPLHSWAQASLVRPIGVVTSREVRFSQRWRPTVETGTRTVGTFCHPTADGLEPVLTDDGTSTVLVVRDGTGAIVPASDFRRNRTIRTSRTASAPSAHRTTAADLPRQIVD